jgi:hypothetical protein
VRIRTRFGQHGAISGSVASSGCTFGNALDVGHARYAERAVDAGCAFNPGGSVDAGSVLNARSSVYARGAIDPRHIFSTRTTWRTVDAGSAVSARYAVDHRCTVVAI